MAEGKKSFLFYTNWGNTFDELSDEDAGKLIKHICDYVRDKHPETESVLIRAVFANIKSILKMDLDKWKSKSLKNSENAKKRWDKKDANGCERIKTNANHADIDNVIVNDNVNVKETINGFDFDYRIELANYITYLKKDHNRDIGHMQVEQMVKMLDSWYKTKNQKVLCLSANISGNWKTLNFVDIKINKDKNLFK